jgi:exodeoxyribonuclease VIII
MNPGVYSNLSNAEYHAGAGTSKSGLDLVNRSPVHLRHARDAANDSGGPTPAQRIGTAFHSLVLEPAEFVREYCLALRPQDAPGAVADRDTLVARVQALNATRKPKLSTSGTKAEMVSRLVAAQMDSGVPPELQLPAETWSLQSAAELKTALERVNQNRPGLLPTTGTMAELAELLRQAGEHVTLWTDVKAEWERNNAGRIVLTPEEWDQLHRMRDALMAHPKAAALFSMPGGVAEQSVYWTDPKTGELCRCRPDYWIKPRGFLVDLKTTEDASQAGFAHSIQKWRYHVQDAFYMDGTREAIRQAGLDIPEPRQFIFIAVEKNACVVDGQAKGVGVYVLDAESKEIGRMEYRADLDRLHECNASGVWPGYSNQVQPIGLAAWYIAQKTAAVGAA